MPRTDSLAPFRANSRTIRPPKLRCCLTCERKESFPCLPLRYAEPRQVDRVEDCLFYHKIDIPGVGVVGDQWDLRACVDDYLGRIDFRGKRVLDVGTAGGFLTFALNSAARKSCPSIWPTAPSGTWCRTLACSRV